MEVKKIFFDNPEAQKIFDKYASGECIGHHEMKKDIYMLCNILKSCEDSLATYREISAEIMTLGLKLNKK
jgi:hypothetical protein